MLWYTFHRYFRALHGSSAVQENLSFFYPKPGETQRMIDAGKRALQGKIVSDSVPVHRPVIVTGAALVAVPQLF
jgi:hypothetical protein